MEEESHLSTSSIELVPESASESMPTTESDSKIDIAVDKEEAHLSTEPTLCNEDSLSKSTPQISSSLASQDKSEDSETKAQGKDSFYYSESTKIQNPQRNSRVKKKLKMRKKIRLLV